MGGRVPGREVTEGTCVSEGLGGGVIMVEPAMAEPSRQNAISSSCHPLLSSLWLFDVDQGAIGSRGKQEVHKGKQNGAAAAARDSLRPAEDNLAHSLGDRMTLHVELSKALEPEV